METSEFPATHFAAVVFNSRSRSIAKMTGVTTRMCRRLLTMPPLTLRAETPKLMP